jgi:ribonuclease HI
MKTGAGAGLLFVSPLGEHMRYAVRLHFPASNNMAEYEALLCGLKIAIELGVKRLDVRRLTARNRSSHEECELP